MGRECLRPSTKAGVLSSERARAVISLFVCCVTYTVDSQTSAGAAEGDCLAANIYLATRCYYKKMNRCEMSAVATTVTVDYGPLKQMACLIPRYTNSPTKPFICSRDNAPGQYI